MITISHTNIYRLKEYSDHLRALPDSDRYSRFGHSASNHNIDQLMLNMTYHPKDHELWYARIGEEIVGWGHMAKADSNSWELAVSVDHDHQRKGIGDKLIGEMLTWAKFHHVDEVFMHCIEENRVIQHLAAKHDLVTRERSPGERTAAIEVPDLNFFEANAQLWKEQSEILKEFAKLRKRLTSLWATPILPK